MDLEQINLVFVGAVGIALLVSSIGIYKGVQILVRRARYGSKAPEIVHEEPIRREPEREREDRIEEEVEKPKKKQKVKVAKPSKRKSDKGVKEDSVKDYIEEWEEPPSKPIEKRLAKKVSKISPNKYPECFGTDYIFQNCKRNCGVAEECERAIKILESAIA